MTGDNKPYLHLESGILMKGPFQGTHINFVPLSYLHVLLETIPLSSHERRTVVAVIQFKEHRIEKKARNRRRK